MQEWELKIVRCAELTDPNSKLPIGEMSILVEFIRGDRKGLVDSVKTHLQTRGIEFDDPESAKKVLWDLTTETEILMPISLRIDQQLTPVRLPPNMHYFTVMNVIPSIYLRLLDSGLFIKLHD